MKKILSILMFSLFSLSVCSIAVAQKKKDGSKDMRFKSNKQHLKKDGTKDMRYKASR